MYVHCPLFMPFVTGEEVCRSLGAVNDHVLAVIQKGREVFEIHLDHGDIRDRIEVEGLTIRGRTCEVSPRFPRGTWVRVRGLPLFAPNVFLDRLLAPYGEVVVKTSHVTWRNTQIKTGDRTLKLKIVNHIPGKIKTEHLGWISLRYKDQPDLCFNCGKEGHQQWECDASDKPSYAAAVETVATPDPQPQPEEQTKAPDVISDDTSSEGDDDDKIRKKKEKKEKKERKERKEKERNEKKRNEKKRSLTSESNEEEEERMNGVHLGLPTMIPTRAGHVDKKKK